MIDAHFPWRFAVLISVGTSCAISANMLILTIVGKINSKLPNDKQISYLWWRLAEVKEQYRRFYPEGRLVLLTYICGAVMVLCFFLMIWVHP